MSLNETATENGVPVLARTIAFWPIVFTGGPNRPKQPVAGSPTANAARFEISFRLSPISVLQTMFDR